MNSKDREMMDRFVACFAKLDHMDANPVLDRIGWELSSGETDRYGNRKWQPLKQQSDAGHLQALYSVLPGRFPPLYEYLVSNYRWADVDLQVFTLLANPIGEDLQPLLRSISADRILWNYLIQRGYIPFGKGSGGDYDPVCFEIKSRRQNADFRVVKVDHEGILCSEKLRVVEELARSFRELVLKIMALAEKSNGKR